LSEKIGYDAFKKVWIAAKPKTGFSKTKLSRLTGLETKTVDRIIVHFLEWDLLREKYRDGFMGYVAQGTEYDLSQRYYNSIGIPYEAKELLHTLRDIDKIIKSSRSDSEKLEEIEEILSNYQ